MLRRILSEAVVPKINCIHVLNYNTAGMPLTCMC